MTIRFSRAEYWLLDAAVVAPCLQIADLPSGDAAGAINKRDHGCTADELFEALERLFADRFIVARKPAGRRWRSLTRSEIHAELRQPRLNCSQGVSPEAMQSYLRRLYHYRLTPAGGAVWESFARPDWNMFIEGVGACVGWADESPCPCRGYAICPLRWMVERYLNLAHQIGHQIDVSSIRWDVLSPWKATYWKTLPIVHRARYKMVYHNVYEGTGGWSPNAHEVFELQRWWRR